MFNSTFNGVDVLVAAAIVALACFAVYALRRADADAAADAEPTALPPRPSFQEWAAEEFDGAWSAPHFVPVSVLERQLREAGEVTDR